MQDFKTYVRTASGTDFPLDFTDSNMHKVLPFIRIDDISHHLALTVRYNGALPWNYSVAHHSLLVADIVPEELKLAALLHDAPEAYTGDLVSPAKKLLKGAEDIKVAMLKWIEHNCEDVTDGFCQKLFDYVNNIPSHFESYRELEARIAKAVNMKFDLPTDSESLRTIKEADMFVEAVEMQQLLGWSDIANKKIGKFPPRMWIYEQPWQSVRQEFYSKFLEYGGIDNDTPLFDLNLFVMQ